MKRALARGQRPRAFTLLELLVVLAIMSTLMVIALPAFTNMGRGGGMRSGVAEVRATLNLARQWAITHRARTYVVFPHADASVYPSDAERAKALKSYAVWVDSHEYTGYIGSWKFLPPGIYFDHDDTLTKNVIRNSNALTEITNSGIWIGNTNHIPAKVYAVPFAADGSLRLKGNSSQPVELFLSEQFQDDATWTVFHEKPGTIKFGLLCYPLTGQIKTQEYVAP
jgi:prepilin-type N-terminal cleavage/methylation domain-containing protein